MKATEAPHKTLAEALLAAQQKVRSMSKDSQAPQAAGGYRYTGVDAIVQNAREALTGEGLTFAALGWSWSGDTAIEVRYQLEHAASGEQRSWTAIGPLVEKGKDANKAVGATLSYTTKYQLMLLLMIDRMGEDDPDGHAPRQQAAPRPQTGEAAERSKRTTIINGIVGILRECGVPDDKLHATAGALAQRHGAKRLSDIQDAQALESIRYHLDQRAVNELLGRESPDAALTPGAAGSAPPSEPGPSPEGVSNAAPSGDNSSDDARRKAYRRIRNKLGSLWLGKSEIADALKAIEWQYGDEFKNLSLATYGDIETQVEAADAEKVRGLIARHKEAAQ